MSLAVLVGLASATTAVAANINQAAPTPVVTFLIVTAVPNFHNSIQSTGLQNVQVEVVDGVRSHATFNSQIVANARGTPAAHNNAATVPAAQNAAKLATFTDAKGVIVVWPAAVARSEVVAISAPTRSIGEQGSALHAALPQVAESQAQLRFS